MLEFITFTIICAMIAYLSWRFLNSRQWLCVLAIFPLIMAFIIGYLSDWGIGLGAYFISALSLIMPITAILTALLQTISNGLGHIPASLDHKNMKSLEKISLSEMWHHPCPMLDLGK